MCETSQYVAVAREVGGYILLIYIGREQRVLVYRFTDRVIKDALQDKEGRIGVSTFSALQGSSGRTLLPF